MSPTDKEKLINNKAIISKEIEEHYYYDNGRMVMTEAYHLSRGYCCGNQCRHCPYEHKNVLKKS
jgi:hypothetical protein